VELEGEAQNLVLQSNDITAATGGWINTDSGDTMTDNAILAPTGTSDATSHIADSTNGSHGARRNWTGTVATYTTSMFIKQGAFDYLYLHSGTANDTAFLRASACSVGTVGAAADSAAARSFGSSWCRGSKNATAVSGSNSFRSYIGEADGDAAVVGDGATVSLNWWGAQAELATGTGLPSSLIPTTTAAVTRNADALKWAYTGTAAGTLVANILCPSTDLAADKGLLSLSDGTADERLSLYYESTGDVVVWTGVDGGVEKFAITGTTDVWDGAIHQIKATWSTGSNKLWVSTGAGALTAEGAEDTSATVGTTTHLYTGLYDGTAQPTGCLLWGVKLYDEVIP